LVTGVSVWVTVETTGVTVLVAGVRVLVAVDTTGVAVLVAGARTLVAVETTGSAVLVTDPSVPPALDVAWVTVLLACASPPVVCLTTGVLVGTTGESAWVAGLTTGETVFVTGATACPAAGCSDEPVPEEPVPWEPLLEVPPCWPKFTAEVAEVTGFVAALTAEPTDERAEDGADPRGVRVSRVDACACLENSIMMTKIPAATIASCIARRATRRAIGCGMSSSHSPEPEDVARVLPAFCGSMQRARG
jgi:hypothetical protein